MLDAVSKLLERLYSGFFLRDILGFVVPGAVSLISLWSITYAGPQCQRIRTDYIVSWFTHLDYGWRVVAFLVASYLLAWTLQVFHYALVNSIARCRRPVEPLNTKTTWFEEYAPLALMDVPAGKVEAADGIRKILNQSSFMTRVSLESDWFLARCLAPNPAVDRLDQIPYTERLSALAIMSSNLAIAILLSLVAMLITYAPGFPWLVLPAIFTFSASVLVLLKEARSWTILWIVAAALFVGVIVATCLYGAPLHVSIVALVSPPASVLLYLEYWRLIRARNLQMRFMLRPAQCPPQLTGGPQARRPAAGAPGKAHGRAVAGTTDRPAAAGGVGRLVGRAAGAD